MGQGSSRLREYCTAAQKLGFEWRNRKKEAAKKIENLDKLLAGDLGTKLDEFAKVFARATTATERSEQDRTKQTADDKKLRAEMKRITDEVDTLVSEYWVVVKGPTGSEAGHKVAEALKSKGRTFGLADLPKWKILPPKANEPLMLAEYLVDDVSNGLRARLQEMTKELAGEMKRVGL